MSSHHDSRRTHGRAGQRGIVLVLALVFLLLSALLVAAAGDQALLQQRMAGNRRHAQLAEIAAESALRGAEWRLWRDASAGTLHCGPAAADACRIFDPARSNRWTEALLDEAAWIREGAVPYRGSDGRHDFTTQAGRGLDDEARNSAVLAGNPYYLIEDLGPLWPAGAGTAAGAERHIYRITARAVGADAGAARTAVSVFAAGGD
ncbi:hypothetical protein KK141_04700 [Dyella sp. LX-66]|uniref:pilus assembly PilX family protein n=1 Tax=unclassified Dyella TaxID=2634549 RepID=UPI001BE0E2E3|nr:MULTISPECIES: PilX N-terminal domain-containing pilus assembly protein [unclassified Dyella]MBT2118137.1 hypothetical protein [Dyella sp. LX-1]MBT2138837.1 hypothetical protein [Dyella sp. LX-66]